MAEPVVGDSVFWVEAVTVRYGATTALAEIDLSIRPGERVAVIGPSGAGKSTLIGVLNGTVAVTEGQVQALGATYGSASARTVRSVQRRIGTIHQRFDLVDQLRVVHNVNAGRLAEWPFWKAALSLVSPREVARAKAALARVGIAEKLHERTGDLSGGQQQRVAIARALVQEPQVILADEPVASVDPARGREIMDLLLELSREGGVTLLAGLHDVEMARERFDRVIGLRAGRIVFDGKGGDLSGCDLRNLYALEQAADPR